MTAPLAWADVVSTDLGASVEFYRSVFGWRMRPAVGDDPAYNVLTAGEEIVAGAEQIPTSKGPPRWTIFVGTPDADALCASAEAAGGEVSFAPTALGDLGVVAMITDPRGATVGVWRSGSFDPTRVSAVEGRIAGAELLTSDVSATSSFLAEVAGWRVVGDVPGGLLLDAGGLPARLIEGAQGQWRPVLRVDAVGETVRSIARAGGHAHDMLRDGLWLGADPTGAQFLIAEDRRERDTDVREMTG